MSDYMLKEDLQGIENAINQKLVECMDGCGYISVIDATKIVSGEFELARAFNKKALNEDKYIGPSDFKEIYEALTKEITR